MPVWDINTEQFSTRGRDLKFYPPKKADARGWSNIITLCSPNLHCMHEHVIPSTVTGLTFKDREGIVHARDRETRIACLGSPRAPLGGDMPDPVYDQQGVAVCGSIILPDGSALHSHGFIRGNERYPPKYPWLVFIPIYNHTLNQFFAIQDYIEKVWIRSLIAEVNKYDDDPRTYSLMLKSVFAGQTRVTDVSRVPTPGPIPNPLQDETHKRDWERVQMICNPYRTPEALVQDLGIGQWNPRYAGLAQAPPVQAPPMQAPPVNPAPPSQTPPAGPADWWSGADDPFGDASPAPGTESKLPAGAPSEALPGSW